MCLCFLGPRQTLLRDVPAPSPTKRNAHQANSGAPQPIGLSEAGRDGKAAKNGDFAHPGPKRPKLTFLS